MMPEKSCESHFRTFLQIMDQFLCTVTVLVGLKDLFRVFIDTGFEDKEPLNTGNNTTLPVRKVTFSGIIPSWNT